MRIRFFLTCSIAFIILMSGCARQWIDTAGLADVSGEAGLRWGIPERAMMEGTGNVLRVISGASLGADEALEMAAGGQGRIIYSSEIAAGAEASAAYRVQFLSTQGTGRIYISALDEQGTALASAGWIFTGILPPQSQAYKWLDVRYQANYVGDWVSFRINLHEFLLKHLPPEVISRASRYRFSIETGQGQHALVTQVTLFSDLSRIIRLKPVETVLKAKQGDVFSVNALLENTSNRSISNVKLDLIEPFGFGIISDGVSQQITELQPGEKRTVSWQVKAQRPDAVNLHKPWLLRFKADGYELPPEIAVYVQDIRPGRIFYVMTEDLEPIDSAGYPVKWGNANGWIDPEELTLQMAGKSEALNRLAERYGAKWTHYTAFPALRAAEWAAEKSSSGKWQEAVRTVQESIRQQANRGHEYSIHLHMDYDPKLPGNVLSYNSGTDGIWANHLRHGWAHSIAQEGDFSDPFSRAGSLFSYQAMADELSAGSPLGQLITARVGSFDFGHGSDSEALSTRAYLKAGLWGSSDADGNAGGITSGAYGREIYLAKPDDINTPAENIRETGLVEFRPTPRDFIMYDSQKAAELNRRADEGVAFFTEQKAVKPGVHGIIGFTHAMFIMGDGDWRTLQGGQFAAIEEHLLHLKTKYADTGIITFGTANDLVKAYLDYYSPAPVALYGIRKSVNAWYSEYEVQILGRDIPFDSARPQQVRVKYPLYLRDSAYRIAILKNGAEVFSAFGVPTRDNDIVFTIDDKNASYSMKVYHSRTILTMIELWRTAKGKIFSK